MGLFGDGQKVRDYGSKINELKTKIAQLEEHGMLASAARLKKELAKIGKDIPEKIKPMNSAELKSAIKATKVK